MPSTTVEQFNLDDKKIWEQEEELSAKAKPSIQGRDGKVNMEVLLQDLLAALGVNVPPDTDKQDFKRALYAAALTKVQELTNQGGQGGASPQGPKSIKNRRWAPNPILTGQTEGLQEEQQPIYLSLEEINKIADPTDKSIELEKYIVRSAMTPPSLSAADERKLVDDMARRMGASSPQGSVSLSMSDEDKLADDMFRRMTGHRAVTSW